MSMTVLGPAEIGRRLYKSERIHTAIEHPSLINAEHMRQYWTDGFLAVNNVFSPNEVTDAISGLTHLIRGGNPEYKGVTLEEATANHMAADTVPPDEREHYVRKVMKFVDFDERLKAMATQATLVGIAERLVGARLVMSQDMALLKPPHIGREKPWHQDTAYFNYKPFDGVIGTWTALDAATPENGCMHVIPGSHQRGPQPHYHDRDCQLPDEVVDVENNVVVPLQPGGALFFHGLLHHGTPPNESISKRRALQFHYVSVECQTITDDEHEALFFDAGGYAGCRYWVMNLPPRKITERVF
jgi:phytanoyl-CoA hydroxylase